MTDHEEAIHRKNPYRERTESSPDDIRVSFENGAWLAVGTCAGCAGTTRRTYEDVVAVAGRKALKVSPQSLTEEIMVCECGYGHEGAPSGATGCGAYWLVDLRES